MKKPKRVLTPAILKDEAALSAVIDEAFVGHPELRRASRRIKAKQRALEKLVSDEAWRAYLAVEEAHNAREFVEMDLLIAWAFEHGRSYERARATSSGGGQHRRPSRAR